MMKKLLARLEKGAAEVGMGSNVQAIRSGMFVHRHEGRGCRMCRQNVQA